LPDNGRDAVFWMSPDWTVMRALDGRGFLSDTDSPACDWLQRYVHPDDHPLVSAAVEDAIKQKTVFELVHRVLRADGTDGWAYSRALPLLNRDGEISEWLGAASEHAAMPARR
jgi:two-component system CheB/CheR fusion protein